MEYCSGGTVIDFLTNSKKYSECVVMAIMGQMLSALTYIHREKIAHRDIKLENMVFLNAVKLTDTG